MLSMKFVVRSIILVLCILTPYVASAQPSRVNDSTGQRELLRYYYGGYAGLSLNVHTANFGALPGFPSCCSQYNDQTTLNFSLAGLLELPIGNTLRFQTRLGYTSLSGRLLRNEVIGNEPVLSDGPVPDIERARIVVDHDLQASLPMVLIEPTIAYQVLDLLWLHAGARAGFIFSNSFEQKEVLVAPDGYVFLNGSTERNNFSGPVPEMNALQLHGVVGLGYELQTRSGLSIMPEVRYYLPLTSISSVDWKVQSFQLGVGVRYAVYSPIDPTIMYDTIVHRDTMVVQKMGVREDRVYLGESTSEEARRREADTEYRTITIKESYIRETARPFTPVVSFTTTALDENGNQVPLSQIRVTEQDVIESYPLLPQVFFKENSANLEEAGQMLLDPEQAKDFRNNSMLRNQIDVYKNLLNVLGLRLKQNPSATLTVTGCTNNADAELNNKELAKSRSEAVKQYLVSSYGIDPSRITTVNRLLPASPANPATPDGKQENQRVEITTTTPELLEPVEFRDKDLIISPKRIVLKPTVTGGEEVDASMVKLTKGNQELYATNDKGLPTEQTWDVTSEPGKLKGQDPIISEVSVQNNIGQKVTQKDTIPFDYVTSQLIKARQEEGKLIERYSLIVFEFNSAQLNPSNQKIMQKVKSRIQPDSKVTITGYADRQGNPEYNRTLARKRCVEAQRALGLPDDRVVIDPVGSDKLVFDNDAPEGRSYSRTVQIEIVTPIR